MWRMINIGVYYMTKVCYITTLNSYKNTYLIKKCTQHPIFVIINVTDIKYYYKNEDILMNEIVVFRFQNFIQQR